MKKYKADLIAIGVICAVIVLFFCVSYLKWLHPVVDCGREFYVPFQILEGRILYKDIYSFYGPFAPYFLALMFRIFGATLTMGYVIGFIVNILISGVIYYISRQLLSPFKSSLVVIFMIILFIFAPSLGGYQGSIIPYSFNALLGMFFILCQIAFLLTHFKNINNSSKTLFLSALFASLAISCKQEYALSSLLLTLFYSGYLLYNKYNYKEILSYWFITLILPVLAYGVFLFFLPFDVYYNQSLIPVHIATNELTQNQVVSFFSVKHVLFSLNFFYSTASMFLMVAFFLSVLFFLIHKITRFQYVQEKFKDHKVLLWGIIAILFLYIIFEVLSMVFVNLPVIFNSLNFVRFTSWIPLFITAVLFIYLINHLITIKKDISQETKIFIFISIAGIIVGIRCYVYMFTGYLLFPLFIAFVYILLEKLPLQFKNVEKIVSTSLVITFICFLVLFAAKYTLLYSTMDHLVQTKYGSFKTFENLANGFNEAIDYINNDVDKNAIISCYPEETMLNFLTRHFSMVMPTEYQYSGVNKTFLKKLGKADYIFISNYPYIENSPDYFEVSLKSRNKPWYDWLAENYSLVKIIGDYSINQPLPVRQYGILVFKKKK